MSKCNQGTAAAPPHVLICPLPFQGHVNSMLHLAEILCLSDIHVTMLLSDYTHGRLHRHANLQSRFSRYPAFRVATISDGLPDDHPRTGERTMDAFLSLHKVGGSQFRHLMESTDALSDGPRRRRVSCLILDAVGFAIPVAEEFDIPFVFFRTISACAIWPYFCLQDIIDAGEIPLKGMNENLQAYLKKEEMDRMVTSVPGMDAILRRRDLSGFLRVDDINDPILTTLGEESKRISKSSGIILNTFEDLEGPILDQIRKHVPYLYSVGPLHAHLKARLESKGIQSCHESTSFWEEDDSCIAWLDSQADSSVIYVSFGSITVLTKDELLEFWHGVVNSGHKFLWVVRPDSIMGTDGWIGNHEIPMELEEGTKSRGYLVKWVAQEEVLAHRAIGAFFTHGGWNSTLESIINGGGLPMLCWAYSADQMTNSRFVSDVWKIGLDIKDSCDRVIIQKSIRDVMQIRRDEFLERARALSTLAKKATSQQGSSYMNLNRFIHFLNSTVLS